LPCQRSLLARQDDHRCEGGSLTVGQVVVHEQTAAKLPRSQKLIVPESEGLPCQLILAEPPQLLGNQRSVSLQNDSNRLQLRHAPEFKWDKLTPRETLHFRRHGDESERSGVHPEARNAVPRFRTTRRSPSRRPAARRTASQIRLG